MFAFHRVSKRYPAARAASTVQALQDVDLEFASGQFVAVIGPSGCGKTTMLEMLAGLVEPSAGEVHIDGNKIVGPHRDVGVVFQEDATFPWLTSQKNVEFGLEFCGVPASERATRARDALSLVGLDGFMDHRPGQLSGGMRQRVNLARVLAAVPRLVLLDEPFGALDEQTRIVLGDEMIRIRHKTDATFMLVTHSLNEAALLADVIVVMSARPGRVVDVITNPLGSGRSSAMIGTPEFSNLTGRLWSALSGDVREAQLS